MSPLDDIFSKEKIGVESVELQIVCEKSKKPVSVEVTFVHGITLHNPTAERIAISVDRRRKLPAGLTDSGRAIAVAFRALEELDEVWVTETVLGLKIGTVTAPVALSAIADILERVIGEATTIVADSKGSAVGDLSTVKARPGKLLS